MTTDSQRLEAAASELSAARPNRHTPSPSSVEQCIRRNWFSETGVKPELWQNNMNDPESYVSAESGAATEGILTRIVSQAYPVSAMFKPDDEAGRELTAEQLAILGLRGGQVDNVMVVARRFDCDAGTLLPGDKFVLELKRKGAISLDIIRKKGLLEGGEGEFWQVQSLMHCMDIPLSLYFAVNWDRSAWTMKFRGKTRPSAFYAEWIPRLDFYGDVIRTRAAMQEGYISFEKTAANVPRDYDPEDPKDARFPCGWCPWLKACKEAG